MQKTLGSEQHKRLIQLLIEAREGAGLTQTQLAEAIGEYQSYVARLESGQRRLDVVEFLKITNVLKCDASSILVQVENANWQMVKSTYFHYRCISA